MLSSTFKYSKILIYIILYIYIYNPVFSFIGVGLVNVLLLASIVYAIVKWKRVQYYVGYYRKELKLSFLMILYLVIIKMVNGVQNYSEVVTMVLWQLTTVLIPIYLLEYVLPKFHIKDLLDFLLKVAFVAAVISILCLLFPQINQVVRSIQITDELDAIKDGTVDYRCYGLATNLTSAYGAVQGVLASIALLKFDKNRPIYGVYFLFLMAAAAINARTGLLPIIIAVGYKVLSSFKRRPFKTAIYIVAILGVFSYFLAYVASLVPETFEFIAAFFNAIISFVLYGDTDGGAWFNMLETFIRFPDTLRGLIFGEGHTILEVGRFESSDIGFINQIFLGGLIFTLVLLYYEIRLYGKMWKVSHKDFIYMLLFMTAVLMNIKGMNFYISNSFTRLIMLLYFYQFYQKSLRCSTACI